MIVTQLSKNMDWVSAILLNLDERKQNLNKLKKNALENRETINKLTATTSSVQLSNKLSESQQQIDDHLQRIVSRNCKLKSKERELDLGTIEQKLEIQELRSQIEVLKGVRRKLELVPVTWMLEKYVATFVLPERVKVSLLDCFRHINKWLQRHAHTIKVRITFYVDFKYL